MEEVNKNMKILKRKINTLAKYISIYEEEGVIDREQVYEYICDCLSWFEINNGKVRDEDFNKLTDEEKKKIRGIKYANNMKKHTKNIFNCELVTEAIYPSENLYPSEDLFPSSNNVYWNILPLDNKEFENQYINYNNYLCKKEIIETLNEVYDILEKCLKLNDKSNSGE